MSEEQGLVQANIVMPAVTPQQAVEAWKSYQELKAEIAEKSDIQNIQGREFYKKSYWRKLATFFNLSIEVVEERQETVDEGNLVFHFTVKATAPNGRYAIGSGTCDQMEKGRKNTIHNTRSTAETRAWNRAVSNLVGGGEVSAEEIVEGEVGDKDEYDPDSHYSHKEEDAQVCSSCNDAISDKVANYSLEHFNKKLCMDCQEIERTTKAG